MLENTRVCYIGPNITGIITVFLTSVQKRSNLGLARAVFDNRRNITVPCYVNTFLVVCICMYPYLWCVLQYQQEGLGTDSRV